MIDSLIFRIHDLFLNQHLVQYLEKNTQGKATKLKVGDEKESPLKEVFVKRYYIDYASGNSYSEGYRGFVKSSNYECAYYINYHRDYVEFNLSLPKYYFGNNLAQLVDHLHDKNHFAYRSLDFWELNDSHFKWLSKVFNHFMITELNYSGVKELIEIVRIDFCYNLVFSNKEDAFYYLGELRTIKRKRFSETSTAITNYNSGVYFPSKDYTVKIYHKGTEFKKHDYGKVKKKFGQKAADQIHHLANNVLRYEVEFRPGSMSDMFITSLKTGRPEIYNCINLARQFSGNGYISIDGLKYNVDGFSNSGNSSYLKMTPEMHLNVKRGEFLRKDYKFYLKIPVQDSLLIRPINQIKDYHFKEAFDLRMFKILAARFKEIFFHFQVGNFASLDFYNQAIETNREERFRKKFASEQGLDYLHNRIADRKLKAIIDLLRDHSWDQIKEMGILSKTVFYRYKKYLKDMGLKNKNSSYSFNIDFTYRNYFDLVMPYYSYVVPNSRLVESN